MHELTVGGKPLSDFGVFVSGESVYNTAEIDYKKVQVPGRSGDLLIPQNRLKNIPVTYPIGITDDFQRNAAALESFLLLNRTYRKIESDYEPDVYRLGFFPGPIQFSMFHNMAGQSELTFDCKPQKFLKSGDDQIIVANGQVVTNKWHPSKPLIDIIGSGEVSVQIGTFTFTISDIPGRIKLDCETLRAYSTTANRDNDVTITDHKWPVLQNGANKITWSGDIKTMIIIPHWWRP